MGDNPYPNGPESTKNALQAEKQRAAQAAPFIDELYEWFTAQVQATDSILEAQSVAKTYDVDITVAVTALGVTRGVLEQKLADLKNIKALLKR